MSWTSFEQVGKIREASKKVDKKMRVDLDKGVNVVFPDGWKINAQHLVERSEKAITGWLTVLWTIRKDGYAKKETEICG